MKIDGEKAPTLISALMVVALGVSTPGCRGSAILEPVKPAVIAVTPAVVPEACLTPAELLRPPGLSRESVLTYPGGVIVNQAGSIADIGVNIPNLIRINNMPDLGLNFADHVNIIYFFAGSLHRPDAVEQVGLFFQAQRPYLLERYCEEQGELAGSGILIALSVADALAEVGSRDSAALERELSENYIQGARIIIGRAYGRIPAQLSPDILNGVLADGFPFRIARFN